MCCFSGAVDNVSKTRIFARDNGSSQLLVYAMDLDAPNDLAMILPIPVKEGTQKIEFIDLSENTDFFEKIEALFPKNVSKGMRGFLSLSAESDEMLEVHKVGSFDASFVPTIDDMDRLDKRFTIPTSIWKQIPEYEKFGFAVFKLTKGDAERHPMGFQFESRIASNQIFFPTVHIHDGKRMQKQEYFDHALYAQSSRKIAGRWAESNAAGKDLVSRMKGTMIEGKVYKKTIEGSCPNEDQYFNLV